ncbi:hypothetical protein [Marinobacter sp. DY40_1A1]|uniref:hypothetical protein n=1 Tax=Marinobacter sp. DY40_1A1 TaxID=2583229 RepID=UPI0019080760|nr:hypothetical protein [Marinobacter sp. DY40_1A1]MBK1885631.1 hypothetical protein [Marinobacter sp. DY40_1A1]
MMSLLIPVNTGFCNKHLQDFEAIELLDALQWAAMTRILRVHREMAELANEAEQVRSYLMSTGKKNNFGLSSTLALRLITRDKSLPSLYWYETKNHGRPGARYPKWERLRIRSRQKFSYSESALWRASASEDEFKVCWGIEQRAEKLRIQCREIRDTLDILEKAGLNMKKIGLINVNSSSSFNRHTFLKFLYEKTKKAAKANRK